MTAHPEVKTRSLKQIVGGWFYRIVTQPGWPRWVALAVAAFLFMLSALYLTRSTDYREDPSALMPRSADVYAETRDLSGLLKTVGAWRVWHPDRRGTGQESRTELEKDLAGLISARVGGLPINPPLRWMSASLGAGWCISRNEDGTESWALYLRLDDPAAALKEIEVEPGMALQKPQGWRDGDGLFSLTGQGGSVHFGIAGPWLILSGDDKLPKFALEAKRRPSQSLAGTGIVPKWRRSSSVRGLFNPSYASAQSQLFGPSFVTNWLSPDARVTYTALLGRSGGVETYFNTAELSERSIGGGLWPLFLIIMGMVALCSICVIFAILLVMVGWGGWFKAMAVRAGIAPAKTPDRVSSSNAFKQDSGIPNTENQTVSGNKEKLSDPVLRQEESENSSTKDVSSPQHPTTSTVAETKAEGILPQSTSGTPEETTDRDSVQSETSINETDNGESGTPASQEKSKENDTNMSID